MKRILIILAALILISVAETGIAFAEETENVSELMQKMVDFLEIGTGDFDQYKHTFFVGNSGYAKDVVYFSFDLRPGNQSVSVNYGNEEKSFIVSTYEDPIKVLFAYQKLLPYFNEIRASLPESHELIYRVYGGECGSESYFMEITDNIYQQHFAK